MNTDQLMYGSWGETIGPSGIEKCRSRINNREVCIYEDEIERVPVLRDQFGNIDYKHYNEQARNLRSEAVLSLFTRLKGVLIRPSQKI